MTATSTGVTRPVGRRKTPSAEFLQIWEEGYVSRRVSYEVMHLPSSLILDGGPLRGDDGHIDRARVLAYVEAVIATNPRFRLRLQRSFLGLTPPAWVPDEAFDLSRHVRFSDEVVDLATADLRRLGGADDGIMPIDHPLWRLRFTALTDGRVALGTMTHHVTNDGLGAMKALSQMCQKRPDQPLPAVSDPFADRRAARAVELPWLALRQWWAEQPTIAAAWRAYWSKSFIRRARRVAARVLLPIRFRSGGESALRAASPPRHSSFRAMEAGATTRYAREVGGTLSDLLLAAMMAAWEGSEPVVAARFPVSSRTAERSHIRNQVRDIQIQAPAGLDIRRLVSTIRQQVDARDTDEVAKPTAGDPIGYATLLPWVSTPRFFAGARVVGATAAPASLGTDKLSAAGILYDGTLYVGTTMPVELDVERTAGRMYELMTGLPDGGRP